MRRPIHWFDILLSIVLPLAGLSLPGCGSSGSDGASYPGDPPATAGLLRQVRNSTELETVLKGALTGAVSTFPSGPVPSPAVTTMLGFSGTYTVEAGVDELDYVRFDGTHLFVAPTHSGPPPASASIRILRTDPLSATAVEVGSIPIESSAQVVGMYVEAGRLLLVTTESYFGPFGGNWLSIMIWAPAKFTVQVHDVRNPAQARRLMSATIDGAFVASRRVDDRVVLVSRHTPHALLDASQRQRLEQLPLTDLLPSITIDSRTNPLVDPRNCYITNDESRDGYPVLTSISTISLASPHVIDGICYDEAADGVYASQDAVYVSEPRFDGSAQRTRIHKFSLQGTRARYAGSVEVPGALWMGGQQDFRMNESGGHLRVITTERTNDANDQPDHRLFVLGQKPGELALEIIGRLPSEARPAELGKPNEELFGVRFSGDRAYAVTFQRIDPLYVIDLSTPTDPRIAGELMLPGFTQFLHPISQNLLLGLGMDNGHFKLDLYDTSNIELPLSRGEITLGGTTSASPALYDRHAFTYLAGTDTDRLAIPATVYSMQSDQTWSAATSLHQFEIAGKQVASSALLLAAGKVLPPRPPDTGSAVSRAIIVGDTVFYVENGLVWGSFWTTPSQVNGPF